MCSIFIGCFLQHFLDQFVNFAQARCYVFKFVIISILPTEVCVEVVRYLKGCKAYYDDLSITGKHKKEHLENIERVFIVLRNKGLKLKKSKCEFSKPRIYYLGYIIDKTGLSKNRECIMAIIELEQP